MEKCVVLHFHTYMSTLYSMTVAI